MAAVRKLEQRLVQIRFTDLPGQEQRFTVPEAEYKGALKTGLGFDGSSIRGFQPIHESDMVVMPSGKTYQDPFFENETAAICDIINPRTGKEYSKDPRRVARRAEAHLKATKIGDIAYFGPELEGFAFDRLDIRVNPDNKERIPVIYESTIQEAERVRRGREQCVLVVSSEFPKIRTKEGYFPVTETQQAFRSHAMRQLMALGVHMEAQHHEVAAPGQFELDMRFDSLTDMADKVQMYKYVLKKVGKIYGYDVTFMPKPVTNSPKIKAEGLYNKPDNGTGMHVHQSIWKGGRNLFAGKGYAGLSPLALNYIGGLLHHAPAIAAFSNPTVNSYLRIVPGFEAPVNLVLSAGNRSAVARIPMISDKPAAKRVEFRGPDPSANPYLTFAACLMAGLDGIRRKMDPGKPIDADIYHLPKSELRKIRSMPGSVTEARNALEKDHEFLLEGGVFSRDLVDEQISWLEKQANTVKPHELAKQIHWYHDV